MTSLMMSKGFFDISKLPGIAPRVTRVTQRSASSANHSFKSHTSRRKPSSNAAASEYLQLPSRAGLAQSRVSQTSAEILREDGKSLRGEELDSHGIWSFDQDPIGLVRFARPYRSSYLRSQRPVPGDQAQTRISWPRQIAIGNVMHQHRYSTMRKSKETEKDVETPKPLPEAPTPDAKSSSHHETFTDRLHLERLHMPQFHRPTKEELLAAATGFWSRLRVRFKWSTIRSLRPFNIDEITGFISWIVLGHVLWIVVGTTTFVSLAILTINTVFAQETLAGWIGNYLTKSTGLKVVFESAVVPKWGDGVITFKNVFVSRRPGEYKDAGVSKGSAEAAAIAAAASTGIPAEDQNYTQFDITLGEVNVTLSFRKWWNSRGLLQNVEIKHVRGVLDRTHVFWTGEEQDPKSYRHEHVPGDFEIDSFSIEDLLVTVHQPNGFRPFPVSIYNADLPRLRKQWMFYDLLSANSMTGEFDRSLFTIHPRQTHSYTGAQLNDGDAAAAEPWKKQSRIRVDALNIDHLNRNVEGPFSWIHEGNVDIVADIMIPNDTDESFITIVNDFYDRMEATLTSKKHLEAQIYDADRDDARQSLPPATKSTNTNEDDKRFLVMDLRVHLNDVRAVVPLFNRDLSYVNNALIRPIVAYINSRRTFIPLNCRVVKRASDFDGSWTIFDSGFLNDLSAEMYEAFARDVTDEQARLRRFKKVGLWSLQLAVQAIFMGLAGSVA